MIGNSALIQKPLAEKLGKISYKSFSRANKHIIEKIIIDQYPHVAGKPK